MKRVPNQRALVQLLFVLIVLFLLSIFFLLSADHNVLELGNAIIPIMLVISLSLAAYSSLRHNSALIWTPLPWFFLSCALYFGMGPLIYGFGNPESISVVDHLFQVSQASLMRTNVVNIAGVGMLVIGYLVVSAFRRPERAVINRFDSRQARVAATIFLIIGLPVKYFLALPSDFGLLDFVLPGSIRGLQILTSLAIVPLVALVSSGYARWRLILYPLVAIELLVAILEFYKQSVLVVLIMIILGLYVRKPSMRTLSIGLVFLVCTYLVLTPLVHFGRAGIQQLNGTIYHATLSERLAIIRGYAEASGVDASSATRQNWWIRLDYASFQAFAMDRYDHGRRGRSLEAAFVALVPRLIWPSKPIISDVGSDFTYEMSGNAKSWSGPGIFGEAYWNGGWLLVPLLGMFVGILFAVFSKYSLEHVRKQHFILLPIVFVGIRMGFRPDGWFVGEYLAAPAIALVLHFLLSPLLGLRFGASTYTKSLQTSSTPLIRVPALRDDLESSRSDTIERSPGIVSRK